jgi:hypothetical protein
MQNSSSDTIGEAYFVKKMFLAQNRWYRNTIVTSQYHIERVTCIYGAILGRKYTTRFEGVATPLDNDKETRKNEKKSIERFERDYGYVDSEDLDAFETALYEKHEIYSKIPEDLRPKFYGDFFISP